MRELHRLLTGERLVPDRQDARSDVLKVMKINRSLQ